MWPEIQVRSSKRTFDLLIREGRVLSTGERRWRRYRVTGPIDQGGREDR